MRSESTIRTLRPRDGVYELAANGASGVFPVGVPRSTATPEQSAPSVKPSSGSPNSEGSSSASSEPNGDITSVLWTRDNIATLRSLNKAAVVGFLNARTGNLGQVVQPQDVWEFGWFDLEGNGKYELAVRGSSGPCCVVVLTIISRDSAGSVSDQHFEGAGLLSKTFRDLNGYGKKEMIVWPEIAEPGTWSPDMLTPRWPAVYRLENGKYVEASRDFPGFYDNEIPPKLDAEIRKDESQEQKYPAFVGNAALLILEKDKILRVLGRNPVAGLNHAYQWMNTDDPQLLQCTIATFRDIGGHGPRYAQRKRRCLPRYSAQRRTRSGDTCRIFRPRTMPRLFSWPFLAKG